MGKSALTQDQLRLGLLHLEMDSLWNQLGEESVQALKGQLQNWTGKTDDLRKHLAAVDTLHQFREADLEPLRTLAVELRANCDDLIIVGTTYLMDLARLQELFDGPGGRGPRLHLPRCKAWTQQLLPALEAIGSKVGLVILGWAPGELTWERTVPPALQWMKTRYPGDELTRRVVAVSRHNVAGQAEFALRTLGVSEKAHWSPMYSGFGLFPLYLAGFEASGFLEGARSQVRALEKSWSSDHLVVRQASARQILTFQEGWAEVVVTPDRFLEPLGLFCQHLLESGCQHLEPPLPYPFPHLQCQDYDPHSSERSHCMELQLDYAAPDLDPSSMERGRPRCWLGLPRLDLYTLGGLVSHMTTVASFNWRWNESEPAGLE